MKYFFIIALFCMTFVGLHAESTKVPYHFGGAFNDIDVEGDYAYVASDAGLKIFDVSDPSDIRLVGTYDTNVPTTGVVATSDIVYMTTTKGIVILDVKTPASPTLLGSFGDTFYRLPLIKDNHLYAIAGLGRGIQAIDVSNPTAPKLSDNFGKGDITNFDWQITIQDRYFYFIEEGGGLHIIDINTPSHLIEKSYVHNIAGQTFSRGIAVATNNRLYISTAYNSLKVIDISNHEMPATVAEYDTQANSYGQLQIEGNRLYVQIGLHDIKVFDISDSNRLVPVTTINVQEEVTRFQIRGHYLYIVDQKNGLYVRDISNLASPRLIGTAMTISEARDILIQGHYAYVADGFTLKIADISNLDLVKVVQSIPFNGYVDNLFIKDHYLYFNIAWSEIAVVDIANPDSSILLNTYTGKGNIIGLKDQYIFSIESFANRLNIIDISDPIHLQEIENYSLPERGVSDAVVFRDHIFLAYDTTKKTYVIDIQDITSPVLTHTLDVEQFIHTIAIHDNVLYVIGTMPNTQYRLTIYDISDLDHMTLLGTFDQPFSAITNIVFEGHFMYGLHNRYGIRVIDMSDPSTPRYMRTIVLRGSTLFHGKFIIHNEYVWTAHQFISVVKMYDSDRDGLVDAYDNDIDGDGIDNVADNDSDNDSVIDSQDALPLDPSETIDFDYDGVGDNADMDDDNDGVNDVVDAFPHDPNESLDTDGDGVGNNADTDDDNDGIEDIHDAFPHDPYEWVDTDHDGIGDNADADDDNDGIEDIRDAFPHDPYEWVDTDHDGIGDNADADDDNDGIGDQAEIAAGLDPHDPRDAHEDSDGDGFDNAIELSVATNIRDIHDTPIWVGLTMGDGIIITIPAKQGQ